MRSLAGERVVILAGPDATGRSLASELGAALRGRDAEVESIEATDSRGAAAGLDAALDRGPVRHLVVASPWSAAAEWVDRREQSVAAGYFACQRWLAARARAGDLDRSTLTAVTGLGGDFGLSGAMASPVGGAFSGLFKNLAREYAGLQVRVVDFPAGAAPAEVARSVTAEIESDGPVETGWRDGRRIGVTAVPEASPVAAGRPAALARGSVWLVSGGARGVTAACALALGKKHGLRLVLLGSTRPLAVDPNWLRLDEAGLKALKARVMVESKGRGEDPRRAWREVEKSIEIAAAMEKFRAAGIDARYEACDLGDATAVAALVSRVERECGPVQGVVHGAGWESACKFEKKTPEGLEATLGPKCVGIEHLLAALDPARLETLVAFGSTSGRLGGVGQADYSAANDMLAKIVGRARRSRKGLRAALFHWHAWDEVGMASRPESRFVLEQFGMKFMPLAEGVSRFLEEIEAGLPEAEVLVTEPVFCLDTPPARADSAAPARGSLVESVEHAGGAASVSFVLSPTSDTFLLDHRRSGRPLLPAVIGAELLAQAARAAGDTRAVGEIRDFRVERGVTFPTDDVRRLVVTLEPASAGGVAACLQEAGAAATTRPFMSGVVRCGPCEPVSDTLDERPFPWNPMIYQEDGPMWHGPSFRTLSGLLLDRAGGWGKLVAPPADRVAAPRGADGWTVPAALLDGAIFACGVYSYVLCGKRVEIPVRFGRLRFVSEPTAGEACVVRLHFVSQDSQETVYDLVIFGADARPILAIDRLTMSGLAAERSRAT